MKLLSIKQARSIWLVNLVDLNPRGLNLLTLVAPIVTKYNFQVYPTKSEDMFGTDIKEIKFSGGSFQIDSQHIIAVDLTIFNDGIVVDTRSSTMDSDTFLNDLLSWLYTEYNLVPYQDILRSKIYVSELWVQTDKLLNTLNAKLENFAKRITSLIEGHSHHPIAYETSGISFWTDPGVISPPNPFRFERVIDRPFAENRYYSAAPLQTEAHFELLEELESILSS
jgi:hypothetical protein